MAGDADLRRMIDFIAEESRHASPVLIRLGDVRTFEKTNVIYISIADGETELHALHENLNAGQLEYDGPYPYHPHVTLAQNIEPERVTACARIACDKWAAYSGPHSFTATELSFVQNVALDTWVDIERIPLGVPVGACR
jgi:2'-5' RNA ligase